MTFAKIEEGSAVFIDANVFVYRLAVVDELEIIAPEDLAPAP
jgi:hypothetical protein